MKTRFAETLSTFYNDASDSFKNAASSQTELPFGLALNKVKKSEKESLELMMFDDIGDFGFGGVAPTDVVAQLAEGRDLDVEVRINSHGGLVFDGLTIFHALADHEGTVTTKVEGIAASIAAIIFQAGDNRIMQPNSQLMVHRAMVGVVGNVSVMEAMAKELAKLDDILSNILSERSQISKDEVMEYLIGDVDGTHFNAQEAVDIGFADSIVEKKKKRKANKSELENDAVLDHNWMKQELQARLRVIELNQKRLVPSDE